MIYVADPEQYYVQNKKLTGKRNYSQTCKIAQTGIFLPLQKKAINQSSFISSLSERKQN